MGQKNILGLLHDEDVVKAHRTDGEVDGLVDRDGNVISILGLDGKTVLYGTEAPTTEGNNGDFYIRITTNHIYGPKEAGVWPEGVSLVGPAGADSPLTYNPETGKMLYNGNPDVDTIYAVRSGGNVVGFKDKNDNEINAVSKTFAEMAGLSPDDYIGVPLICSDKHSNINLTGGSIWIGAATGQFQLMSGAIVVTNVSDAPAAASYPGLRIFSTAVGAYYKSDGEIYVMDQDSAIIARRVTPSKAIALPTQGWAVSSVNTSGLAAGLLRLVGAGTHGLTAAQTTTPSDGTWIDVTAGTGWTPGLYKINSVTDSANNIIIEALSTANVPTVTSANTSGSSSPVLDTITIPPMNKYGELEVDFTIGVTAVGGAGYFITPKITYDSFLMLANAPAIGTVAGAYAYRSGPVLMRNKDSVNSQTGTAARLANSQIGGVIQEALQVGAVNSGIEQTLKIGVGSSIANQRCWIDSYTVRMRG